MAQSKGLLLSAVLVAGCLSGMAAAAEHDQVTVTPLGGQDGEFCSRDRALVFEDPNGTRILYDAGRTVAGPEDPRLGDIDVVLVSHVHGDHIGDRHIPAANAGSCATADTSVNALPNSNSVNIAVSKGAKIVTGSDMPSFFATKLKAAGGDPANSVLVRFGAMQTVGGVGITTVPAVHSNGVAPGMIEGPLSELLAQSGLSASVGPPTGYVLTFSNGLVVYLSGDTGITAEQKLVVNDYYDTGLAVMNIGDTYTTGPREAAYVVNDLVQPNAVIASHANEVATKDGKVIPDTRTDVFIKASQVPVHVPLSGITMSFDRDGRCTKGC
ncbi:MBL fold metallo-hydrolase [Marinobacter caseinilyticus]|uniref:MBL fold metallo-hydrolase n=1 Tax=Marinobacter caseinilyticus TaxID=2692195 RepID=UPI00140D9008|nr:MBL fold metallo-hydrolase [Marinobacter caseinilyticus]